MPRVQDAIPSLDCRAWKGHSNPLLLSTLRFAPESRPAPPRGPGLLSRLLASSSHRLTTLGESPRAPPSGPAFALGRTPGTRKESCCLDRHIRTVLGSQFFHDMANMHFYSAFAHVQFVGDDLVRLALMDRADNGE